MRRYRLSLSTYAGLVIGASHYWCRLYWRDRDGEWRQADAEHGRGAKREMRFADETAARVAGIKLASSLSRGRAHIVTEGSDSAIDPQDVLVGPAKLRRRANALWVEFEQMGGWGCSKDQEPALQKICDAWTLVMGGKS